MIQFVRIATANDSFVHSWEENNATNEWHLNSCYISKSGDSTNYTASMSRM